MLAGVGFDMRQAIAGGIDALVNGHLPETQYQILASVALSQIEELRSGNRGKDEVLAIIAHELRSPLASIESAIGVLRQPSGEEDAVRQRMHELIERQVRQMGRLVADLLDVSRVNCGQLRLQRDRIDLHAVLTNAIETVELGIRERRQRLTTLLPGCDRWLLGDVGRLEQVFVNLLANASKYTDAGGELALSLTVCEQEAVVRVRDSGVGIGADALPHIFDLFTQGDPAAARSRSGLGVGLALVRSIVELHGGSVTAASAGIGQGSEFTVRLPFAA
jgi:two-component system CheB/CheR fusion protein